MFRALALQSRLLGAVAPNFRRALFDEPGQLAQLSGQAFGFARVATEISDEPPRSLARPGAALGLSKECPSFAAILQNVRLLAQRARGGLQLGWIRGRVHGALGF